VTVFLTPHPISYEKVTRRFQIFAQNNSSDSWGELRSKGYVSLMNVILEIKNPGSFRKSGRRHGRRRGRSQPRSSGKAILVVGDTDRFIPTQLEKDLGISNERSDFE
jgi:hypothetical protein